jgi:hypothetical protein
LKITNRSNLPLPIFNAIKADPYTRGKADISITGLIAPARQKALERLHWNDLTEDAADRIFSLLGQIGHGILERAADPTEALTEERLFMKRYGWTISGQFDRMTYSGNALQDYKFTSTYTVKDGVKPEWEAQLNLYRLLLTENGKHPDKLQIVVIFRDWMKSKARNLPDYPQVGAAVLDVPIWPLKQTEAYLIARLNEHGNAQAGVLPDCTDEERWRKPDAFAVFGEGNTRATAIFAKRDEAEAEAATLTAKGNKEYHVEARIGENTRCMFYCAVSDHCDQWAKINPDRLGLMSGRSAA